MGHDLRVGFRHELVALTLQLVLQIKVVLDDPVVDDDDLAGAVPVWVSVFFGRPPVGGPSRVPDAVLTGDRMTVDDVLQARQFAGAPAQLNLSATHDRD